MAPKFYLGIFLGVISICGFALNLFVIYAVVLLGIFQRKSSTYVICSANMFCDIIQLLLIIVYLLPSILLDSWLFDGGKENIWIQSLGTVFVFCWYFNSITQMLMAITRLIAVCFPSIDLFSFKNVTIIVSAIYPVTLLLTLVAQYVLPCCKTILRGLTISGLLGSDGTYNLTLAAFLTLYRIGVKCRITHDHTLLSFSYSTEEGVPNYINMYVDAPLDFLSSATCIGCYIYIVVYMWKMKRDYQVSKYSNKSLIMEYRYALQFFAISIFFLTAWVCFRLFPLVIGREKGEFFVIVSVCTAVNCSANAMVYITSNSEVRRTLKISGHSAEIKTVSIIFTNNVTTTIQRRK